MSRALGWQRLGIRGQEAQGSLLRRAGGEEGEGEIPRGKKAGFGVRKGQSRCGGGGVGSRAGSEACGTWGNRGTGLLCSVLCWAPLKRFLVQRVQSCHTLHSFSTHSAFFFFLYPLSNIVRTVIFPWCCLHTDTFFFLLIN